MQVTADRPMTAVGVARWSSSPPAAAPRGMAAAVRARRPPNTRPSAAAGTTLAGAVLQAVVAALSDGSWSRLRQCPDCRLVFWDRTRNASKVWCGMYAGSDGRACGSIAKVRRYSKAFTDGLEAAGAVPYVHSLRDPVQVQRFWDLGIPVYSDEPFPPLATAAARPPALQDPTFSDADGTPPG
jgi:hypothetical protein